MTEDDAPRDVPSVDELVETAEHAPAEVDVDDLLVLAEDHYVDRSRLNYAVRELLTSDTVDAAALAERLRPLVEANDHPGHVAAVGMAGVVADVESGGVRDLVPALVDVVGDDGVAADAAYTALDAVADAHPDALTPEIERLGALLERDSLQVQYAAVSLLSALSETCVEELRPLVSTLVAAVETEPEPVDDGELETTAALPADVEDQVYNQEIRQEVIREQAAVALAAVAEVDPAAVRPHAADLLDCVTEEYPIVSELILDVVRPLAATDPDALAGREQLFVDAVREGDTEWLRASGARVLGALVESRGAEAAATAALAVPAAVDLFDDDTPEVRASAAGLLAYVAEYEPEAVERYVPALVDRLDDGVPAVRVNAVWALRDVGTDAAREALAAAAEDDPNPEVRELAAESVDATE